MKLQSYLIKLFASDEFKKFKKEYPDSYFCSAFFSIDKVGEDNQQHLDFYIPSTNKMFSFQLEKGFEYFPLEFYDERVPNVLKDNFDFDFEEVERMFVRKLEKEKVDKKIQKMLFSLQNLDGKEYIIATIFVSGMGIIKMVYEILLKKIVSFEKKSFFDLLRIKKK